MTIETSGQTTLLDVHPGAYGDVVTISPQIEETETPVYAQVGLVDRWQGMARMMHIFGIARQREGLLQASTQPHHRARLEAQYTPTTLTKDVLPGAEQNRENMLQEAKQIYFRVTGHYALHGTDAELPVPATAAYQEWLSFRDRHMVGEGATQRRAHTKKQAQRNLKIYGVKPGFK